MMILALLYSYIREIQCAPNQCVCSRPGPVCHNPRCICRTVRHSRQPAAPGTRSDQTGDMADFQDEYTHFIPGKWWLVGRSPWFPCPPTTPPFLDGHFLEPALPLRFQRDPAPTLLPRQAPGHPERVEPFPLLAGPRLPLPACLCIMACLGRHPADVQKARRRLENLVMFELVPEGYIHRAFLACAVATRDEEFATRRRIWSMFCVALSALYRFGAFEYANKSCCAFWSRTVRDLCSEAIT